MFSVLSPQAENWSVFLAILLLEGSMENGLFASVIFNVEARKWSFYFIYLLNINKR